MLTYVGLNSHSHGSRFFISLVFAVAAQVCVCVCVCFTCRSVGRLEVVRAYEYVCVCVCVCVCIHTFLCMIKNQLDAHMILCFYV